MNDFDRLNHLMQLKTVERMAHVGNRNESSAEHTWGCLIFADYLFRKYNFEVNKERVFQLLLYHDVVEIEAGDTYFLDEEGCKNKDEKEEAGFQELMKKIPEELREIYASVFKEYQEGTTREAQLAHAIDKLEPAIHLLNNSHQWKDLGIDEAVMRRKKQSAMEPFPDMKKFFEELLVHLKEKRII